MLIRVLEALSIPAFLAFFIKYPELDLSGLCRAYQVSSTVFGLILTLCAALGIWMLRHSQLLTTELFVLVFLMVRTRFQYVELFQGSMEPTQPTTMPIPTTTATASATSTVPLTAQDIEVAKQFLYKQTESDPNKTQLEKTVINDIIKTYFGQSDKLKELRNFDVAAQVSNPLPGHQIM